MFYILGITALGLDHTNILGNYISEIAWHKVQTCILDKRLIGGWVRVPQGLGEGLLNNNCSFNPLGDTQMKYEFYTRLL